MQPMLFKLHDEIPVKVNGEQSKGIIIGYELGHWLRPIDWVYHFMVDAFSFHLSVNQTDVMKGCNVVTNGVIAKVLIDAKDKAK